MSGEGDADSGARAKKIAQPTGWYEELLAAVDGHCLDASRVEAKGRDVEEIIYGRGQRGNIRDEIVTGIIAVEEVEEFDERRGAPTLAEFDWAADTQIGLQVGSAAEFVEGCLDAVDDCPIADGRG